MRDYKHLVNCTFSARFLHGEQHTCHRREINLSPYRNIFVTVEKYISHRREVWLRTCGNSLALLSIFMTASFFLFFPLLLLFFFVLLLSSSFSLLSSFSLIYPSFASVFFPFAFFDHLRSFATAEKEIGDGAYFHGDRSPDGGK